MVKMAEREKNCPFHFFLEKTDEPGLKATIKNISDKLRVIICEDYWHPTRITITGEDGSELKWKNVYPPVEPPPAMYHFLKPDQNYITNDSKIHKNDLYKIVWAQAQEFVLKLGKYKARASWNCNYGTRALYDEQSYEEAYFISKELENQWTGTLVTNELEFELP